MWIPDTYQVALHNTALSVQNFKAAMAVPAALGLDPSIASSGKSVILKFSFSIVIVTYWVHAPLSQFAVHRTINDNLGSILPSDLQRSILNGIFSIGRMQLSNSILNENNPLGSSRLSKLRRIFEEGKSLQLQFPAEDLGFRYSLKFILFAALQYLF